MQDPETFAGNERWALGSMTSAVLKPESTELLGTKLLPRLGVERRQDISTSLPSRQVIAAEQGLPVEGPVASRRPLPGV